jgi:hypothetical protein
VALVERARAGTRILRAAGLRTTIRLGAAQAWSEETSLGLRCPLEGLPERRPARVPVAMEPTDCATFDGFERELERVGGTEAVEILVRAWSCRAGVRTLYVASDDGGGPLYCQWLITDGDQTTMHARSPDRYPALWPGEVLLEGAYTFTWARGQGVMADGMWQLLDRARAHGARTALTYVAPDNVPSLRGCANVGFRPDHVRRQVSRGGRTRFAFERLDPEAQAAWDAAIAPRR